MNLRTIELLFGRFGSSFSPGLPLVLLAVAFTPQPGWAALDTDAPVILIRYDATGSIDPCGTLDNCFEYNDDASPDWTPEDPWGSTTAWIWDDRAPSATEPLLVDVGPGTYPRFVCNGSSHVTLRGSGREQSIIKADGSGAADTGFAAFVTNCDAMSFISLGFHGGLSGVGWFGEGLSTWTDTDIVGTGASGASNIAAWYDFFDVTDFTKRGTHYFHGSRVRSTGTGSGLTSSFYSQNGDNWFFGGEILLELSGSAMRAEAGRITNSGELRVFGTAFRSQIAAGGKTTLEPLRGVAIYNSGEFHAHGSVINTNASASTETAQDVTGIYATGSGAMAHTPGTAFIVKAKGTGTAERLSVVGSATALSPFLWESGTAPPAIESQDGSDLFVETDCSSTGCSTSGNETHLLIYNEAACGTTDPWFDVVEGACR